MNRRGMLACALAWMLGVQLAAAAGHRGPRAILVEESGDLLVLCEKSGSLARLDRERGQLLGSSVLGERPFAMVADPAAERLYVSLRYGQEIVELELGSLEILRRIALLGEPTGLELSNDRHRLYVGLHSLDQVAVLDLKGGEVEKRLLVGNGPEFLRLVGSSGRLHVTSLLSRAVAPGEAPLNELTVLDDATARVAARVELPNANIGREIAFTADGEFGVMALSRPKNLIPAVQVARGWMITNGFALLRGDGSKPPLQLLIDLPNQAFADVHGAVWHPSGRKFYLSASGVDQVVAVELSGLLDVEASIERGELPRASDHLGLSRRYVSARVRVGANPMGMAVSGDGRRLYVANRLDDSISEIDTESDEVLRTLPLAGPDVEATTGLGERLFHGAQKVFQTQFSCASCHPDGGVDGLQYDLEPDGIGQNILDNRNLRDVDGTAPFKWTGTNPDIATQCGTRTAKWIVRTGWLDASEVVALADYIHTIPPSPNPYRSPDGRLSKAQRRGKRFFERTTTNAGELIPEENRCHFCHSGPKFTNRQRFDVGTTSPTDTKSEFDSAHLNNVFESPPYLHDGRAATLEEIWTVHNPDDSHGISSDWTKQQLNDLVEYLKSIRSVEEIP